MDIGPLHVPRQTNPLYCKPNQLANPSSEGGRVQYEKKEFTDWINSYLQQMSFSTGLSDLQEDLADGITLLCFVQQISFEAPPCIHSKPALYVHRLENTEACLSFLGKLGVDVSGVYAEDVARGNIKTILALCRAMYIRFEGDVMEDHRCLSPVLSWKHKSPSLSLNAPASSEFAWPLYPWKQEDETLNSGCQSSLPGDDADTGIETRPGSSIFTVWYKEDMAVIGWIQRLLGLELKDYSEFADGILLCAIVNQLWEGSITQEEVIYSTPLERLEIATEAAMQFLGVPRTKLDLKALTAGQGRDELPWYLLELKAVSERMYQEYMAIEEERNRTKDEEENVNQMRRHLIRKHAREQSRVSAAVKSATTRPISERTRDIGQSRPPSRRGAGIDPKMKNSPPRVPVSSSQRRDATEQRASHVRSEDATKDRTPCISKSEQTLKEEDRKLPITSPPISSAAIPDATLSTESAEMREAVEQLETSLSALMQPEMRVSPLLWSKQVGQDASLGNDAPPVPWNSYPSLAAPPWSVAPSIPKQPSQPDISTFFSPFSMPFVSVGGRRDLPAKYESPNRNSSSSVVEDDSLARGKLTSWSEKNVRNSQGRGRDPALPSKPPRSLSTTLLARLAARSPGGLAGMSSSDSDG